MLNTVIAVVSALLGAVVSGVIQHHLARSARAEARDDHRRDQALEAVKEFAAAVAGHRRTMTVREGLRLDGATEEAFAEARAASHATRSAIEAPKVMVSILVPSLAPAAEEATRAVFALRGATDKAALDALREDAITAADRFVAATSRRFA
ncbi:protein kilB [Streptomyces triculaminicus]|uniref:protein kilB n=1 Tax=Streptomyces triculaminicus TaxID=2816232 RepID=UPI0037D518FA